MESKRARESQLQCISSEWPTHKIHEVTPGQKPLEWRASHIKIEKCAINHAMYILSHVAEQMLMS